MSSQADPPPSSRTTPLAFGYSNYLRFGKLIYDRYGLNFPEKRLPDLERGVRQAFAASTCSDLDEYFELLQDPERGALHIEQLLNAITISETHFFRDAAQVDALYECVLPEIIQRRRPVRSIRIWSAGCASGEEPYSIAMLLRDLLPDVDEWSITILGTDINTDVLHRARKGVFGEWAFREERAKLYRTRYFRPNGNRYELAAEVRRMVTFQWLNLAEESYPAYATNTMFMDLILCRNVMIYFSQASTLAAVNRFYEALVDGGWLVIGHSEHSITTYQRFQTHNFANAILYRRTGQPSRLPAGQGWLQQHTEKEPSPFVVPNARSMPASPAPAARPVFPATQPPASKPSTQNQKPGTPSPVSPTAQEPDLHPTLQESLAQDSSPLEQARELIEYGLSDQAEEVLLKFLRRNPAHAEACTLLGQVYANKGSWSDAEKRCQEAIQANKLALGAYYTLALVLRHKKQLPQAIEMMKKVVYIDNTHILGHYGLADLYYHNQQIPQALKSLDNALRLLNKQPAETVIPASGGITVERLRQTITRQQQQWSKAQ